jgi:nucleoside-diphosphate-sugar epimerase
MPNQPTSQTILIIGGSGFLSGTLAQRAVAQGHQVWIVTRGQRPTPAGVTNLVADRHNQAAFEQAIHSAQISFDLVVDCIGYQPADAQQDITIFSQLARHLIFVSTDFVYDPARRRFPQGEETEAYLNEGYGGQKRLGELSLINGDTGPLAWTIVRPCHIYGPGSELGCLPLHSRDPELINRFNAGEALALVGGGHFLQQPILARDLADLILSMAGNPNCFGQLFCAAGPDIVESRTYYQIIADILGVGLTITEVPVAPYLADQPNAAVFLCHRIYDLSKLRSAGVKLPSTPLTQGLREHVEALLSSGNFKVKQK